MKGQYFLKDKKAMVYRREGYKTPGGHFIPQYRPIAPVDLWCYTKQLSMDQLYAAMAYSTEETRLFVFNHLENVKTYDAIMYKGQWYEITRVDTTDDYNTDSFVYVKQLFTPSEENVLPF